MPIKDLESRQSGFTCFSGLFRGRTLEAGLPPVYINITPNLNVYRNVEDIPWTNGGNVRNHRWRWRAGIVGGDPTVQVQVYGYVGAHVELRATAPRSDSPRRPAIELTPNENVNGGQGNGWGEAVCLSVMNIPRPDMTYTLFVRLGNMYR
ncbi:hypothetical protein COCVIDRAFT_27131 [Bipolaris victoriae FI3]|uniref:Uncharacterized protein n=1 Tax=Bipolaris victoriae (strain FI3) TaxID=930091 RepID=W7EQK9_BIPV3|nr:hypothetical protein COCVIDRAFT_27131 [Bipolaris victoriae FI3]